MFVTWTPDELRKLDGAHELQVASPRDDGTLGSAVPIWVVCVATEVYVRTWYRRDTGWFGRALRTGRARIAVSGWQADVTVADIGLGTDALRAQVDGGTG